MKKLEALFSWFLNGTLSLPEALFWVEHLRIFDGRWYAVQSETFLVGLPFKYKARKLDKLVVQRALNHSRATYYSSR